MFRDLLRAVFWAHLSRHGNLSHHNLVVHDAMAHPADTSAIRVVGRFRERWLSYALLPEHAPANSDSENGAAWFWNVVETSQNKSAICRHLG